MTDKTQLQVSDAFWGNTEFAYVCLGDVPRTEVFRKAIQDSVKPGDIVVDLGAGTGILGLTAAEAGAEKVYLVECDGTLVNQLTKTIEKSPYRDRLQVLQQDVLELDLPEPVDVVICELIATGLIDELQVPAMEAVRPFCKPDTDLIPESYTCSLDLVWKPTPAWGHSLFVVSYDYSGTNPYDEDSVILSETVPFATIDFRTATLKDIHAGIPLRIEDEGQVNGLRLSGQAAFPNGTVLGATYSFSMPMILPLETLPVSVGDQLQANISYQTSGGLENLRWSVL